MITVLQYLVIAVAIGLVIFAIAMLVFGRGEQLQSLPANTSPAELPDGAVAGEDLRKIRFAVALRGYRMSDVDWTLEKSADEIDRLRAEVIALGGDPDEVVTPELLPERDGLTHDEPIRPGAGVDLVKNAATSALHASS